MSLNTERMTKFAQAVGTDIKEIKPRLLTKQTNQKSVKAGSLNNN